VTFGTITSAPPSRVSAAPDHDAPITHVIEHNPMLIDDCFTFVLGPDKHCSRVRRRRGA